MLGRIAKEEGIPMVQAASLFNQLLQHFLPTEFGALVKKHKAERCAKGFGCWTQLVSMLFCQLAHADSLREICNGLGCCLFISGLAKRSTNPPCPTPTNIGPRSCMKICFIWRSNGSGTKRAGPAQKKVPFQKQAAVARFHHHHTLSGAVSVGQIPQGKRRRQGARSAGPR